MLLCEADILINRTSLLDGESRAGKRASKSATPWVQNVKQPQLTKGWVNALDAATDAEATWRELTAALPSFWPRYNSMSIA